MKKIITIISTITLLTMLVTVFSAVIPIGSPDMSVSATQVDNPLEYLHSLGIIEGYPDGKLHPEANLTRAEFAAILDRVYPKAATHQVEYMFSDLNENHWAYNNIQKVCNAGWFNGYSDGTFCPDRNVTFEQAVTVVCRAFNIAAGNGMYPYNYVSSAIDKSVSDGVDARIGEEITRYQAATLIVNAIEHKERCEDEYAPSSVGGMLSVMPGGAGSGGGGGFATGNYSVADESSDGAYKGGGIIVPPMEYGYEEYATTEENIFKDVSTSPLSTFSIDTDTASYSNLRRHILNNKKIPDGLVRTEELINYFDYVSADIEEGQPFGVKYTVADCPWNAENKLTMITVSGEELEEPKPSNLVFLIDTSGSMISYNKLPFVKESLEMLINTLDPDDRISVVTYASDTGVLLESTPVSEKETILNAINGLKAGGGTAGGSGITLAYEQAEKSKVDGNNRIILCTDGDFNVGISSESELEELIEAKRESGIFLSVLGFGMGNYKDNKMEILADKGNGNYAYIDNLREAKKVLVDEMSKTIYTIAKDVKIQVEFNPEKVAQYRLVGYENRVLNNEDFENDMKDAGELGSGASVTVFYEIIPSDGTVESDLIYQETQGVGSDDLMMVKIRYKEPDGDESILTEYPIESVVTENPDEDFWFAAAVAELGMIINESEYKGISSLDSVIEMAEKGKGEDTFGIRCEFVQLADLLRYKDSMR